MIAFWIAAAGLSAATAGLVLRGAARARPVDDAQTRLEPHRRRLAEVERLAIDGLLAETELKAARVEAGRGLLAAADQAESWPRDGLGPRKAVVAAIGAACVATAGLYVVLGRPELPDQPYAQRVAEWKAADPSTLEPEKIAAVLEGVAAERPKDVEPLLFLAKARAVAGDLSGAEAALRKAVRLAPKRADVWSLLGETFVMEAKGDVGADAKLAFGEALKVDPNDLRARYYLARGKIAEGDVQGGLSDWRALRASLPTTDPGYAALSQEMAQVEATGRLPSAEPAADANPQVQGMIAGMVEGLAARLAQAPDDPDGWVRLVRAYAVLGETAKRDAALARATARFKDQPKVLSALRQAADTPAQKTAPEVTKP
ncbi:MULTISPECIES: c-type cytochrome biogenesis protein CcmI [unclassified Caulobacter]|uniref:c-type cytochrome biogenesis protein CcmI n=1 Tax=unclassified Caulobacter TaxID=2648921 RepID=UPI0006F412FB|nr:MULTISPECIES: c-type cytochrome biogenesis protein CcmI [unclassified Caulobacter]KQV56152.1 cytochrome C biogenesis protein CycH [Caulobacter sp. Root342]KQV70673.1 cytochrome C biogenesis protein CycH [Caulobacter sp. Root343]